MSRHALLSAFRVPGAGFAIFACVALSGQPAAAAFIESTAAIPAPALRTGFPVTSGGPSFSQPPVFVDLELDGRYEIVAVDNAGRIYIVGANGVNLGGWPKLINGTPSGPPAIGDLDLDGYPEIVCATTAGVVYGFTFNGAEKFVPVALPGPVVGSPVLVELDATGRQQIVIATQDGHLHAITSNGSEFPGWPLTGPGPASGGAFTFIAFDNFPRVGYLASPGGASIFFTYGLPDPNYSFDPGVKLGPALPVSGARKVTTLNDIDHLYLPGRNGGLWRFDPDVLATGGDPFAMTGIAPDSVFDTPSLVDLTDDLIPELALRSLRGDTLSITLVDGAAGAVLAGWPRKYLGSSPGGGIIAADLGDGATPEIVFNQGGDKITCVTNTGSLSWTLPGLPSVSAPALGDMDADGGLDLAVVTTDGRIMAYTLGTGGIGPRGVEWPTHDGVPDRSRRHHLRDRAAVRAQWPPPVTPENVFTTRPVFADVSGDALPEALWSDYATSKTFCWQQAAGVVAGFPQTYGRGMVPEAPAVGDVTGDGVFEAVNSTDQGYIVYGNKTGTTNSLLIENGRTLSPPSLADLNADGVLDVVVGTSSGRLYGVNLVTRTILPGFPVTTAGAITLSPAVGDITGDGQTDIVVVGGPRTITAYPRTGSAVLAGWPKQFVSGSVLTQPILVPVAGQTGLAVSFGQTRIDSVFAHLVGANGAAKTGWPKKLSGINIFGPVAGDFNFDNEPDFVFSTDTDSMYVFVANGNRALARLYTSPGDLEVAGMVDVDLDQRPDIIAISDRSVIKAIRFNGLVTRSFDRLTFFLETNQPPVFGDLGNDGTMDMALSDLGAPILYSFGAGSWNAAFSPWPMKGHDPRRTNAFSGLTVVDVGPIAPGLAPGAGWARATPNPAVGRILFSHSRPMTGRYEAAVYDLRGRLVRQIARGDARTGEAPPVWTWDGRDEGGASVRSGVYFYRVADDRGELRTRVVRLQ